MALHVVASDEALERELSELIQDEGLVEARLGVGRETIGRVLKYDSMQTLQELKKLTMSLGDDKYAVALQNAFGITWPVSCEGPADNLTDRRKALLESGDFPRVSEATLRRWEKRAIRLLVDRVIAAGEGRTYATTKAFDANDLLETISDLREAHQDVMDKADLLMELSGEMVLGINPRRMFSMSDAEKGIAMDMLTSIHTDQEKLNSKLSKTISDIRHY